MMSWKSEMFDFMLSFEAKLSEQLMVLKEIRDEFRKLSEVVDK